MKIHYYKEKIKDICLEKHLTVDEIYLGVQKKYPQAGKSTIYRNVEEMVKDWSLKKIAWIKSKALFESTKEPHIHLIDEKSWEVMDLPISSVELSLPDNFELSDADIRIFGNFKKEV